MILMSLNKTFLRLLKTCFIGTAVFLFALPLVNAHLIVTPPPPPGPFPKPPPPRCPSTSSAQPGEDAPPVCCKSEGTGEMIVYQSGKETFKRTDMVVKGVYPISITRIYSSDTTYDSQLGYGWAFSFDKRLFEYPDQSIVIRHGCGNINRYIYSAGSYQADTSIGIQTNVLIKNADGSFTLTYPKGQKDQFDIQGRLIASFDIKGNSLEYSYDASGKFPLWGSSPNTLDPGKSFISAYMPRLTQIQVRNASGEAGNSVSFSYDSNTGRTLSITANDGRVITYQHDVTTDAKTLGNLTGVTGLDSKVSIYKYEDRVGTVFQDYHNITHIQEGVNDTPAILTYNNLDQAYIEKVGNQTLTFDFTNAPFSTSVTETFTDDQNQNPQSSVSYFEFSSIGLIEFKRDALGNETRYTLDNFGHVTKELVYQGGETTGVLIKTLDRTFNGNGNILTEATTLASGEIITKTYTYDGAQIASMNTVSSLTTAKNFKSEWAYNYDTSGNASTVQEKRRYQDNGSNYLSTTYTYNGQGNVLTTTLPDGHVIVNEYGLAYNGRYVTKTYHQIAGVTVPNLTEIYTYDNKGNRTTVTDARGKITTTVYDDLNRRKTITNHLGHIINYTYDDRDNLTQIIRDRSTANDQLDITQMTYDGENRLIQIERSDDTGVLVVIKQNTYDSSGQLLATTNSLNQTTAFGYDLLHRLTSITNYRNESITYTLDALGNRTAETVADSSGLIVRKNTATYDALNRQLTQVGSAATQTTTYTYDAAGNRSSMNDALSRPTTQYNYDTLSRLTSVQDANVKLTQYTYYDRGWLNTVTDPRGLVTTYNYNNLGQLTSLVSPDTATTAYTYDLAGNKQTKTDARNIAASYTYDDLNRLTSISYPDTTKNVTFTYDQGTNGLGKLTGITDESGSTQYEYNHWGDLTKETKTINGQSFIITYGYDTEHRLVGMIYPSGRVITLNTDALQDIVGIDSTYQSNLQTITSGISYLPFGGVDQMSYGNGLLLNQDYDQDYRLTLKQVGTVYDRTTQYNDVNNITNIINNLDITRNQTFIYDNLDRLTDATSTGNYGTSQYNYDDDGNRTVETLNGSSTNYSYSSTSNRLSSTSGAAANSFAYDNNGNTQTKNSISFTYDDTNRMSQAVNGATTANYLYDGKGQRVMKQVGGTTTLFIYDKDGKLIAETDGAGATLREYVYFGSQPVALAKFGTGAGLYYVHSDHLNTPQVLTDQSQAVVWAADYEPFGKVNITTSTIENPLRFPGQYYDQETQLHYNYYRDYDPSLGRYTQSDPIGLNGGVNTYIYVFNNPVAYFDPWGLECVIKYHQPMPDEIKINHPEQGFMQRLCYAIPLPTGGIPDPRKPNKRPSFPGPLDVTLQFKCEKVWVKTKDAWVEVKKVMRMGRYNECTDECGNVTVSWLPSEVY